MVYSLQMFKYNVNISANFFVKHFLVWRGIMGQPTFTCI
jgi:hypothetical protein